MYSNQRNPRINAGETPEGTPEEMSERISGKISENNFVTTPVGIR